MFILITEIKRTFSTRNVIINVGYSQGIHSRLTHSHSQQGHEKYRQDDCGNFALDSLLREKVTLAVFGGVGMSAKFNKLQLTYC